MALIVQKYGGSSVADASSIKRVAKRVAEAKRAGHDVVVVVSAMGDTTDELIDLAQQVTPLPPQREMDILLTAGERISMSLLAMAIHNLGVDAKSFTGQQAGVITDEAYGKARIIDVTPSRIRDTRRAGLGRHRRRVPGRQPVHQRRDHARSRRLGHHGGRARRVAQGRRLRDLHGRRRRVHRGPADRADRPQARPGQLRRDARARGQRRQGAGPALRRVRAPVRGTDPRALVVHHSYGHAA